MCNALMTQIFIIIFFNSPKNKLKDEKLLLHFMYYSFSKFTKTIPLITPTTLGTFLKPYWKYRYEVIDKRY